jgi:integrase
LRLLFARMQRHRLIALNPLDDIRAARTSTQRTTLWLTRQQARALEDTCAGDSLRDLRDRALIVLMLATGLRASETLSLSVADLTSAEGHRVAWVTGKGGARERVKLAPKADRAIRAWLDASVITDGPLFRRLYRLKEMPGDPVTPYRVHASALAYTGLKFVLQERFAEAGLSPLLTPHGLRHSFVTLALRGGAPLTRVQAAARHKSPQTTMRYAHEQDELDDNAVDYVKW